MTETKAGRKSGFSVTKNKNMTPEPFTRQTKARAALRALKANADPAKIAQLYDAWLFTATGNEVITNWRSWMGHKPGWAM